MCIMCAANNAKEWFNSCVCVLWCSALFSRSLLRPCNVYVIGPNLNCVGFAPYLVEGDCFCRVPDSRTLEYGECMELTVEVSNTSSALSCKWFANMVEQVRNDPRFFFKVEGDKNQV